MSAVRTPALLVIMDGCGLAPAGPENAVSLAKRPYIDMLNEKYPHTTLGASGEDVGLPDGQMGNSEVGHLNIGAGRIVFQSLSLVNNAIKDGSFKENDAIVAAMDKVKANGSTLHVMGLVSNGGVHSEMGHAEALLEMAGERGLSARAHRRLHGRPRRPHAVWCWLHARPAGLLREGLREVRQRHRHRDGRRPLLRHGPRQPLGPRAACL